MAKDEVMQRLNSQQMPPLAGVFDFSGDSDFITNRSDVPNPPLVVFDDMPHVTHEADGVSFDNFDGGKLE